MAPPEILVCGEWWNEPDGAYNPDCPDADSDQIYDGIDQCPDIPGNNNLVGCPDWDYDGVFDHIPNSPDLCPETPYGYGLVVNEQGCDDRDGDGIFSDVDVCPYDPGTVETNGCPPAIDRDGDGILNFQDWCPARNPAFGPEPYPNINGCPDYDFDTLAASPRADNPDFCSHVAGPVENGGCPPVIDIFSFAAENGAYENIIVAIAEATTCVRWGSTIYGDPICWEYSQ